MRSLIALSLLLGVTAASAETLRGRISITGELAAGLRVEEIRTHYSNSGTRRWYEHGSVAQRGASFSAQMDVYAKINTWIPGNDADPDRVELIVSHTYTDLGRTYKALGSIVLTPNWEKKDISRSGIPADCGTMKIKSECNQGKHVMFAFGNNTFEGMRVRFTPPKRTNLRTARSKKTYEAADWNQKLTVYEMENRDYVLEFVNRGAQERNAPKAGYYLVSGDGRKFHGAYFDGELRRFQFEADAYIRNDLCRDRNSYYVFTYYRPDFGDYDHYRTFCGN